MRSQIEVSLEFSAAIVELSNDAIIAKDLEGVIHVWNAAATTLFGYSREEMIGEPILRLIPEDRRHEEKFVMDSLLRGEAVTEFRTVRLRKDGGTVNVTISVTPLRSEDGRVIGGVKTIRDAADLSQLEARFRLFVDAAPNALVVVNDEGRIAFVSQQTERLFGYGRKELIGQPVGLLIPERFRAGHDAFRQAFRRNPEARVMGAGRDLCGRCKDGTEVPVEIALNAIATPTGTLVLASLFDIRKRKRALAQLEKKQSELQRSNQDLEQFAYVASHDLQEPLRAISGFVEILEKRYVQQLDARAKEYIGHVVDGCNRMRALIDDLLAFSRIGRIEGKVRTANCEASLAAAMANLSSSIAESGAQITKGALPVVGVEPSHITMLFQNLIGNALKFRQPSQAPQIHVEARTEQGRARFSVADNGIGIAPEHFERIFRVFQRLHTRNEYPGTGIGLAICKRIVEHNGGTISLESSPGAGTTFHFDLPLPQDEAIRVKQ